LLDFARRNSQAAKVLTALSEGHLRSSDGFVSSRLCIRCKLQIATVNLQQGAAVMKRQHPKRYGWWRKYNGFWEHPKCGCGRARARSGSDS